MEKLLIHGPNPNYFGDGDRGDAFNLPERALQVMLIGDFLKNLVVVPDHPSVNHLINFYQRLITNPLNVYRYPYDKDQPEAPQNRFADIALALPEVLKDFTDCLGHLSSQRELRLNTYQRTKYTDDWSRKAREYGFNISPVQPRAFDAEDFLQLQDPEVGRSGWSGYFRNIDFKDPNKIPFYLKHNLPYPTATWGFLEELEEVFKFMQAAGVNEMFLKPIDFSGGTIRRVKNIEEVRQYIQEMKQILGEERAKKFSVEAQELLEGILFLGSFQYYNGNIMTPGDFTIQLMGEDGQSWIGNIFGIKLGGNIDGIMITPEIYLDIKNQANQIFDNYKKALKRETGRDLIGPGGIDFAVVVDQGKVKVVVLEQNSRRFTGGHYAIFANEVSKRYLNKENQVYMSYKIKIRDLEEMLSFIEQINRKNPEVSILPLNFDPYNNNLSLYIGSKDDLSQCQITLEVLQKFNGVN